MINQTDPINKQSSSEQNRRISIHDTHRPLHLKRSHPITFNRIKLQIRQRSLGVLNHTHKRLEAVGFGGTSVLGGKVYP